MVTVIQAHPSVERMPHRIDSGILRRRGGRAGTPAPAAYCGVPDLDRIEPHARLAETWWPPLRNVWTPVGWKDHLFRFAVLYNGTVFAQPHVLPETYYSAKWADQNLQLSFYPSSFGDLPVKMPDGWQLSDGGDGGVGDQGWSEDAAPVLWTEWLLGNDYNVGGTKYLPNGLVLRQEIFAHLGSGSDVKTGVEPLYAWIRLSVSHVDELRAPEFYHCAIHVGNPHVGRSMFHEDNLNVYASKGAYPRELTLEITDQTNPSQFFLKEANGNARLAGMTSTGAVKLVEREEGSRDYFLDVTLPCKQGYHVDFVVPMLCEPVEELEQEMKLTYEGALDNANAFWSQKPSTAATVETPEAQVNGAFRHSVRLAEMITETNPENGQQSFLTGSWNYERLWATPTSMTTHMLLDLLGHHPFARQHLKIFRENQGQRIAPGPAYKEHPGYFSAPEALMRVDWVTDHGAILQQICKHALLSGDEEFIEQWTDPIIKACDFLKDARAMKGHGGVEGVLPPATATDEEVPIQATWNVAWSHKAMRSAVRLLKRIDHPRAEEFEKEAEDMRAVFRKSYAEACRGMPTWKDKEGKEYAFLPTSLSQGANVYHPFYLDAGPLVLVWAGLMDADEDMMRSMVKFFREGPNQKIYDARGNMHQRAVLTHEISSCEPCYSWNIYHSWQLHDRRRYLEGMYSLLTAAMSDQTFSGCEHRHGIFSVLAPNAMFVHLARLSVIDDELQEDELQLLRLVPLAWLRTDFTTRFDNMPTEYGPVSIQFKLADAGKCLEVHFQPPFRQPPREVILHIPPVPGLEKALINGESKLVRPGEQLRL